MFWQALPDIPFPFYQKHSDFLATFRIDDPVDAIAVHGAGGIVGILAVPVFMEVRFV